MTKELFKEENIFSEHKLGARFCRRLTKAKSIKSGNIAVNQKPIIKFKYISGFRVYILIKSEIISFLSFVKACRRLLGILSLPNK